MIIVKSESVGFQFDHNERFKMCGILGFMMVFTKTEFYFPARFENLFLSRVKSVGFSWIIKNDLRSVFHFSRVYDGLHQDWFFFLPCKI